MATTSGRAILGFLEEYKSGAVPGKTSALRTKAAWRRTE